MRSYACFTREELICLSIALVFAEVAYALALKCEFMSNVPTNWKIQIISWFLVTKFTFFGSLLSSFITIEPSCDSVPCSVPPSGVGFIIRIWILFRLFIS